MFFKIDVLQNFASFAGKYIGWSLVLIKVFYKTPPVAASIHVTFHVSSFLLLSRTSTAALLDCYFLRLKKHFRLYVTTTTIHD